MKTKKEFHVILCITQMYIEFFLIRYENFVFFFFKVKNLLWISFTTCVVFENEEKFMPLWNEHSRQGNRTGCLLSGARYSNRKRTQLFKIRDLSLHFVISRRHLSSYTLIVYLLQNGWCTFVRQICARVGLGHVQFWCNVVVVTFILL